MSYCPICSALQFSDRAEKCCNCDAIFTNPDGLRPLSKPLGPNETWQSARRKKSEPIDSSKAEAWQVWLGLPLLLVAAGLLLLAGIAGPLAAIPAFVYLIAGIAVMTSTTDGGKAGAAAIGILLLLMAVLLFSGFSKFCFICK